MRAALVGAAAAGCSRASPPEPSSSPPPTWAQLRDRLTGQLVTSAASGYASARRSFNPAFDVRRPAAVAQCISEADVQTCIRFAADTGIPVAARSGGHSYPQDGLVVDVSRLADVTVSGDTATIGAGARLIDVYNGVASAGRMLGAGSCPTVAIAGLTLGGGLGVLNRKFGLTCDQLASARMITADGTIRVASAQSEPDLFWSMRGGGGGNFGIATEFTFTTASASELTVFSMDFAPDDVALTLTRWLGFMVHAPDELWTTLNLHGGREIGARVVGCINPMARPAALIEELRAAIGLTPTHRFADRKNFLDAMNFMGGCADLALRQCQPSWTGAPGGEIVRENFVASSRMIWTPHIDRAVLESILDRKPGLTILFDGLGGAVSRIRSDETAFPHRSALASAQIYYAVESDPSQARANVDHARDVLGRAWGETGYVNYIDARMPNWAQAHYGDNLTRLRNVAQQYDPHSLFGFAQGIRP